MDCFSLEISQDFKPNPSWMMLPSVAVRSASNPYTRSLSHPDDVRSPLESRWELCCGCVNSGGFLLFCTLTLLFWPLFFFFCAHVID